MDVLLTFFSVYLEDDSYYVTELKLLFTPFKCSNLIRLVICKKFLGFDTFLGLRLRYQVHHLIIFVLSLKVYGWMTLTDNI